MPFHPDLAKATLSIEQSSSRVSGNQAITVPDVWRGDNPPPALPPPAAP